MPPAYADSPPPYAAVAQTVTTTTTYPNGQQVVIRQNGTPHPSNGFYPSQTAAYSYPGQTVYTTYGPPTAAGAVPGQSEYLGLNG